MTPELSSALAEADPAEANRVLGLLAAAGAAAVRAGDVAALLYGALFGATGRDCEGVDPLLVGAVLRVFEHRPSAVVDVVFDLNLPGLPGMFAAELLDAAVLASRAMAAGRRALAFTDTVPEDWST